VIETVHIAGLIYLFVYTKNKALSCSCEILRLWFVFCWKSVLFIVAYVIVDVRDTLIQALGLVVCYRESLTALENVDVQRYVPFCVC